MTLDNSLSIYIHIPFCQTKCPYCDFNSYETSRDEVRLREKAYAASLIKELVSQTSAYDLSGRKLRSVFFGGGTPSLLSADVIGSIISEICNLYQRSEDTEITLEANPRSIQEQFPEEKLSSFLVEGINRISFGAQSFNEEKLNFLGRWHTPEDTIKSFEMARRVGFDNINLDLMFGVKGENPEEWKLELTQAIACEPDHISTYMLTMEPGTVFGKRTKKGEVFVSEDDAFVEMYQASQTMLGKAGYEQYEISNFSKPGKPCDHNIVYWSGGEYLGLGAGAHSFIKGESEFGMRWSNTPSPVVYVTRVTEEGNAVQIKDPLNKEKALLEKISFSLRMTKGISIVDFDIQMLLKQQALSFLIDKGFLELSGEMLRIPENQLHLADSIVGEVCDLL